MFLVGGGEGDGLLIQPHRDIYLSLSHHHHHHMRAQKKLMRHNRLRRQACGTEVLCAGACQTKRSLLGSWWSVDASADLVSLYLCLFASGFFFYSLCFRSGFFFSLLGSFRLAKISLFCYPSCQNTTKKEKKSKTRSLWLIPSHAPPVATTPLTGLITVNCFRLMGHPTHASTLG